MQLDVTDQIKSDQHVRIKHVRKRADFHIVVVFLLARTS